MRRSSVRVRLTALYSVLFIAMSVVLLVNTNLLLQGNLKQQIAGVPCATPGQLSPLAVSVPPELSEAFGRGDPPHFAEPPAIGTPPHLSEPPAVGIAPHLSEPPAVGIPPHLFESPAIGTPQHSFGGGAPPACTFVAQRSLAHLAEGVLHRQWVIAIVLIALLGVASIGFGWWLSGRVLRPLRRITETARRLSLSNLHERIALAGPPDELFELANTFDTMLARLEVSVASQRSFIGNAAHELRTPLAIQRAAIQIGLDQPSPERLARVRAELLEVNRRNERLIDGLLILAQSDHGLEATEPVALDALVRQVLAETPVPNGLTIRQDLEPAIVEGDAMLLQRLVANLVLNAIRYNTPDGMVDIQVTSAGTLIVRNTGPEIPEELIGQLFVPFARLRNARTRAGDGTGLGLSIVASIARAHDAAVSARPNRGGGLELTVQFRPIRVSHP